jgi:hypothetical protein
MSNYKSISLLIIFSKVLERVMQNRLSYYLQANSVLIPKQFGFRKGIFTKNSAFRLTDGVLKSVNQKMYVDGICCDLKKCF